MDDPLYRKKLAKDLRARKIAPAIEQMLWYYAKVDPRARLARAQGGVLWSEFNRETQVHGLATTGGVVGSTGISGLTLGGGLGWLMPKWLTSFRFKRS